MTQISKLIRVAENAALRHFMVFIGFSLGWIALDLALQYAVDAPILRLPTAYLLPFFGTFALILLYRVARQGVARFPARVAAVGALFIVGGAAFDLATTVTLSPDLSLEGNPYIRVLLDSAHSLPFVYCHLLLTQMLYVLMFCGLWLAFLRHLRILMETIEDAGPQTTIEFLKAATGGAHLTHRQWLLPLRATEVPILYHSLWAVAIAVVFGISLFRWYAGLEWLGVVEASIQQRFLIVAMGVTSSLILYFMALWRIYQTSLAQNGPLAAELQNG